MGEPAVFIRSGQVHDLALAIVPTSHAGNAEVSSAMGTQEGLAIKKECSTAWMVNHAACSVACCVVMEPPSACLPLPRSAAHIRRGLHRKAHYRPSASASYARRSTGRLGRTQNHNFYDRSTPEMDRTW